MRRGITFLEIVLAIFILSIAVVPIFWVIHKGTEETDVSASQSFATNKATEILNTFLDNIPFECIRQGAPAGLLSFEGLEKTPEAKAEYAKMKIDATWVKNMAEMLFPKCEAIGDKSWRCQGIIQDPRGTSYLATLLVEDVLDTMTIKKPEAQTWGGSFYDSKDLTFSYCKNPEKLQEASWRPDYQQMPVPIGEWTLPNQIGLPAESENIYCQPDFYPNTKLLRYSQCLAVDKVNYATDDSMAYCGIKRLIVQIQWNIDKTYFSKPDVIDKGNLQRIHLMTIKADINR